MELGLWLVGAGWNWLAIFLPFVGFVADLLPFVWMGLCWIGFGFVRINFRRSPKTVFTVTKRTPVTFSPQKTAYL